MGRKWLGVISQRFGGWWWRQRAVYVTFYNMSIFQGLGSTAELTQNAISWA